IDWDPALRAANQWFDRLAAATRLTERSARTQRLAQLAKELKELKAKLTDIGALAKAVAGTDATPQTRGKAVGDILLTLAIPAVEKVQQASDRVEQIQRNNHVAFALAAYQRDEGKYPAKLAELAPKYLASVPEASFTGK